VGIIAILVERREVWLGWFRASHNINIDECWSNEAHPKVFSVPMILLLQIGRGLGHEGVEYRLASKD
jgi:hypothetical protein